MVHLRAWRLTYSYVMVPNEKIEDGTISILSLELKDYLLNIKKPDKQFANKASVHWPLWSWTCLVKIGSRSSSDNHVDKLYRGNLPGPLKFKL